jgi:acetyl esterase/lipase
VEADNTDKTGLDRRGLLGLGAMAAALAPLAAQAQTPAAPAVQTPLETIPLWPGKAPGGEKVTAKAEVVLRSGPANPNDTAFTHITDPILMVRRPAKPNGAAIVMAPGGGYIRIAQSRLGGSFDKFYADQGVTVFILLYRLPGDGWAAGPDVALQDVQRAIRLIRSRAAEFQLDPARVGVIGFSAGGHVAGLAATRFADKVYEPVDAADSLSARPMVAGLFFPVITAMLPYAHKGSIDELIGKTPTDAQREAASIERHVPADAPPTFVAGALSDNVVPPENAYMISQALRARKIPTELHEFELGGHGLRPQDPWQEMAATFFKRHGLYT